MSRAWQRSWVVATAGAFVSTVIVFGVARCRSVEREEWRRVRARAAVISAPFARAIEPHTPLLGTPRPGFADKHYVTATELLRSVPLHDDLDDPELQELLQLDELPAGSEARLARYEPMLLALAAGAAADQVDYRTFFDTLVALQRFLAGEVERSDSDLLGGTGISTAALAVVRCDLAGGRQAAAVQRTADVLTLARDQLRAGFGLHDLLAVNHVVRVCELWNDARLRALPAAQQQQLAEVLLRLDVTCEPATSCPANEAQHLVSRAELHREWNGEPEQFDAFLTAVAALPANTEPWSVRQPALAAASACLPASQRVKLDAIERARRDALARVRLLRMALAHRLGESVPVLLDPFGESSLQANAYDGGVRFASSGTDLDGKPIERVAHAR